MNIEFKGKYKSLNSFKVEDLEGLCIITGKNGSGKTQFLELFTKTQEKDIREGFIITPNLQIGEIQEEGLTNFSENSQSKDSWKNKVYESYRTLSLHKPFLQLLERIKRNNIKLDSVTKKDIWDLCIDDVSISWLSAVVGNIKQVPNYPNLAPAAAIVYILEHYENNKPAIAVYDYVSNFINKPISKISIDDLYEAPIDERLIGRKDLFYTGLDELVYNYSKRRHDNFYRWFMKNEINDNNNSISDHDFASYDNPIVLFNEILAKHKIPYQIMALQPNFFARDVLYSFRFIKNSTNQELTFQDLSSGEQIIIGLITKVFLSNYYADKTQSPKLLLLDEPDAHLHPELSKLLIDVLEHTFCKTFGMTVIMTTHSPTTIAVAPDNCIWKISNGLDTRLERTNKDVALSILTQEIPTLSVNYENRRQVFVESKFDVQYYEGLYNKLSHLLIPEISLNFISSGDIQKDKNGRRIGNCAQVIEITNTLRKAGNNLIWGIVDWDKTNTTSDYVKVLGNSNRYSIENYLLDPVILGLYLLREKIVCSEDMGLKKNDTYLILQSLSQNQLQAIVDYILEKIKPLRTIDSSLIIQSTLINNLTVELPEWFLHYNGHELEEIILSAFPKLHGIKKNMESALKLDIINKVIHEAPEFVSTDILKLFKDLQKK